MELIPVTDAKTARKFILVNPELNRNLPGYIRPIDNEIEEIFDPASNKTFRNGECARWLLVDGEGRSIGRIAAFINKRYKNKGDEGLVGGIGFFDCINSQDAADLLFDVARHWLLQRGATAMDGPINFGERDKWWGLVTDGFHEPLWSMNYNPPFYQQFFENYGFKVFFNQICFGLDPQKDVSDKLNKRHDVIEADPDFKARIIEKDKLDKYAGDFTTIYNKAYAGHGGLKEMKKEQVVLLFKRMKPLMDEKIVWFVYYKEEPIAMFINIPELNQYYKHFNGRFGLLQKLQFVWLRFRKSCRKFTGLVFAIVPEFQGRGIDAFIIAEAGKLIRAKTNYADYEMQWVGDFNPKMINVAESIGNVSRSRNLVTYRYLFDRTKEFKRHPMLS